MCKDKELPTDLKVAVGGFTVLGALLSCADPVRWASMARPPAADLGMLILALTERANSGLEALGFEIPL